MSIGKQYVQLHNGHKMPLMGFGTYKIVGEETIYNVVDESFKHGFRSIDTAEVYRNEEDIGLALKKCLPKYNLTREDIFITSKLDPIHNGNPEAIKESVRNSLNCLGIDYLDLYLIHWPGASRYNSQFPDNPKFRDITWKTLVDLHNDGILRSIGVSNYTVAHLTQLLNNCHGVRPAINQVELHPFLKQEALIEFCKNEGIHIQAYSSLGSSKSKDLLNNDVICSVAKEMNVSPARLLLKWALQQGIGIIPKAVKPEHIADNSNLDFHVDKIHMKQLSELPSQRFAWNPEVIL